MPTLSTFSIVGFDPGLQAWGIAVASKFPAVGAVVPWARAGAGAVATQAFANTSFGPDGLAAMESGVSAPQALQQLLAEDEGQSQRQVGLVDAKGGAATFTGEDCYDWAGGLTGEHFAVQGNILTGLEVIEAMAASYKSSQSPFPDRLLAALLAGDQAGGDRRGRQSAALLLVRAGAGYAGFNDRWLDYRVDDHADPIPRLIELAQLHQLYFGQSEREDQVSLEGQPLQQLQRIMDKLGYYQGAPDGVLTAETKQSLRAFLGNENFEERIDLKAGLIDKPVLDFLKDKFSG
jgi:uncharacterized Ntn-hydrolase superfamily protein